MNNWKKLKYYERKILKHKICLPELYKPLVIQYYKEYPEEKLPSDFNEVAKVVEKDLELYFIEKVGEDYKSRIIHDASDYLAYRNIMNGRYIMEGTFSFKRSI